MNFLFYFTEYQIIVLREKNRETKFFFFKVIIRFFFSCLSLWPDCVAGSVTKNVFEWLVCVAGSVTKNQKLIKSVTDPELARYQIRIFKWIFDSFHIYFKQKKLKLENQINKKCSVIFLCSIDNIGFCIWFSLGNYDYSKSTLRSPIVLIYMYA